MLYTRRDRFLPFAPPSMTNQEIESVSETLRSDWISTGPKTKQFEEDFCRLIGSPATLALNSCTAGLHLSLLALGVGPGDEVIVPALTFAATANVVEHVGAKPVFADIEDDTYNICPKSLRSKITSSTKAIIAVHYAGHPADLDALIEIAHQFNLALIEDAAHAISAKYKGEYIGASDRLTSFSLYATKNLTTGEGGLLTGSIELIDKCRPLSLHGMTKDAWKRFSNSGSWSYEIEQPGFKYNMSDILASVGIVQLKRLEELQRRRREIFSFFNEALQDLRPVILPTIRPEVVSSLHLYVIRLRLHQLRISRDTLIKRLHEENIGASLHYQLVPKFKFYREKYGFKEGTLPVAESVSNEIVSLPLSAKLSDQDIADVAQALRYVIESEEA